MKLVLIVVGAAVALVLAGLLSLAHQSKTAPRPGLLNGELAPCRQSSNCVNTMMAADIGPLPFTGPPAAAWREMRQLLSAQGGTIEYSADNYLWATFSTPVFGFVDDVELLLEPEKMQFQIRSASRVGRSDFNANRKRVMRIIRGFLQTTGAGE